MIKINYAFIGDYSFSYGKDTAYEQMMRKPLISQVEAKDWWTQISEIFSSMPNVQYKLSTISSPWEYP